jgi:glucose/arabinose dehydrogenase
MQKGLTMNSAIGWAATAAVVALTASIGTIAQQPPAGGPPAGPPQTPGPAGQPAGPPGGGRQNVPGSFQRLPPLPFPDAPQEYEMSGTRYRVVPVVKGLVNPWSLTFLPNGDMLVTEKPGRLRVVRKGTLDPQAVAGVPEVWATGQGGLLEVLPHPRFHENQLLYLTYSKPCDKGATTALHRARFDGKALTEGRDVLIADNCNTGNPHFGSKLAFGSDGLLYMTIGDRGDRNRSQNTASHGGKILRLKDDGTVPTDNPFAGKEGYKPEIFSYGHRNAQGLAFHPQTGVLWSNEHGPQGGDELNIVQAGKNYGWPVAGYGREYAPDGAIVSAQPLKPGIEEPVLIWSPSIGISGLIVYTGDAFPQWKGNLFAGALSGLALHRIGFNEKGGLLGREALLSQARQRVRDVRQGPDGNIYLAIDANPGGVLRVEPVTAPARGTAGGL